MHKFYPINADLDKLNLCNNNSAYIRKPKLSDKKYPTYLIPSCVIRLLKNKNLLSTLLQELYYTETLGIYFLRKSDCLFNTLTRITLTHVMTEKHKIQKKISTKCLINSSPKSRIFRTTSPPLIIFPSKAYVPKVNLLIHEHLEPF